MESDIPYVAKYFDGVIIYSSAMGLTPAELADVKDLSYRKGIQVAMTECLILWKRHDPVTATHKVLLELLLKLRKEEVADQICQHLTKCEYTIIIMPRCAYAQARYVVVCVCVCVCVRACVCGLFQLLKDQ